MAAYDVFAWRPDGHVWQISPPVGSYWQACIHPDGTHALFWGGAVGPPGVWRAGLATGKIDRITSMVSGSWHPAYGLAGDRIVFASDRFGAPRADDMDEVIERRGMGLGEGVRAHIFIANADGTAWRPLTAGPHRDERPALSPDGTRVVFASDRGGGRGIWTVPTAGELEPEPLVTDTAAYRPWWSADGETVYFFTLGEARHQLCAVPSSGGGWRPLANDDRGNTHGPYADPGGEHLLAHSTRGGGWGLYEFPLGGGEPRALRPPGIDVALHPSRSRDGVVVFDAPGA